MRLNSAPSSSISWLVSVLNISSRILLIHSSLPGSSSDCFLIEGPAWSSCGPAATLIKGALSGRETLVPRND